MNKKRLVYLDVYRFLAVILVLIYHMSIHAERSNITSTMSLSFLNNHFVGVIPFVIVSGYSLEINNKKLNIKSFYLKRAKSILPMLWIVYFAQYFLLSLRNGQPPVTLDQKVLFSILGMDGYLINVTHTLYLGVGEWFIGMIIVMYILYPILNKVLDKSKVVFLAIAGLIYLLSQIVIDPTGHPSTILMLVAFMIGMFLGRYKLKPSVISFVCSLLLIYFFSAHYVAFGGTIAGIGSVSDFVVSIAALFLFMNIFSISNQKVNFVFKFLSSIAYPMTLINQQVMSNMFSRYSNQLLNEQKTLQLYISCILLIMTFATLIFLVNNILFRLSRMTLNLFLPKKSLS